MATSSFDGTIKIWNIQTMKCLTTLTKINAFTTNTYENLKN